MKKISGTEERQSPYFSSELRSSLERHLRKKQDNAAWLYSCLEEKIENFPYRIASLGEGEILSKTHCYPRHPSQRLPHTGTDGTPRFLVNIPEGKKPSLKPSDEKYHHLVALLKTESFEVDSVRSLQQFDSQVAVVIGTNQLESLDPAINRAFETFIVNTDAVDAIACQRFGFLWRPSYNQLVNSGGLYSPKESFLLVKAHSSQIAENVRALVEEEKGELHSHAVAQIPYQKIRNTLLKSRMTRDFLDKFQEIAPSSAVYLTVMDSDCVHLRLKTGVFTQVSREISKNPRLSVVGCGYAAALEELPIIRLAVQIDMAVRTAMTLHVPYSAYLPEPFLCVVLRYPGKNHHLARLSFLGDGNGLESRRLIDCGRREGLFTDEMAFLQEGIVTTAPRRWKTEKNQSYAILKKQEVKTKIVLQALRGLRQSHAHPKKWADQVYAAIDISCPQVTDMTQIMMHIFGVFDPISRMFASAGQFSSKTFDRVISSYQLPLTEVQKDILQSAEEKLATLGMSSALILSIMNAARASGLAIYKELMRATM